ncbi:MAG: hypothetical protein M3R08_02650, partial [Bacteroidota bacterium]|nr:hypothetical protein [Bacteroidota bacterium]
RNTASADLYAGIERTGVRATTIERSTSASNMAPPTRQFQKDGTQDHFTDAAGNIYRQAGDRTQLYENGRWNKLTATSAERQTSPATQERQTARPVRHQEQRSPAHAPADQPRTRQPQPVERDPGTIQRDRQRGIEREQKFQHRTPQRATPSPRSRPGNVSPGGAPGRSGGGGAAPLFNGGGGGTSPSRSSGGSRGR